MRVNARPVSLDPALVNLKDAITAAAKLYNWNVITKEFHVSEWVLIG